MAGFFRFENGGYFRRDGCHGPRQPAVSEYYRHLLEVVGFIRVGPQWRI
jgi:hypothetical protein